MIDKECLYGKMELLLKEVDMICRNNNIVYYLIEEALVAAVRGHELPKSRKSFSIAIRAEDVNRFLDYACRNEGRNVELLLNNKNHPGFNLKFIDKNTTSYDITMSSKSYIYNSLGINIFILFDEKKVKNVLDKINKKIDIIWSIQVNRKKKSIKGLVFLKLYNLVKHSKKSYNLLENDNSNKKYELFLSNGKCIVIDKAFFGNGQDVDLNGHLYKLPDEAEKVAYMTNNNSLLFNAKGNRNIVQQNDIISLTYPGLEFINNINSKGINLRKCTKEYTSFTSWRKKKFTPIWNKRKEFYSYYYLTKDRFRYYKQFCGEEKENIMELYNSNNFNELNKVLGEYINDLYKYNKNGRALYFDKEIYIVSLATIMHNIYQTELVVDVAEKKVEKLLQNVDNIFWQHFQPIELFIEGIRADEKNMEVIRSQIKSELVDIKENISKQ